jgi:hypothetical protein
MPPSVNSLYVSASMDALDRWTRLSALSLVEVTIRLSTLGNDGTAPYRIRTVMASTGRTARGDTCCSVLPLAARPGQCSVPAQSYRPGRLALRLARAAFKSCLNKSISDGVSIRGIGDVASSRPGKALAVELLSPPIFELSPKLISQSADNSSCAAVLAEQ